jgi:SAM-dependent methyltransferase
MTIYERLSVIYDSGWGDFSLHYTGLVDEIFLERGVKKARVLDLACGTGVLAIDLARKGHTVHGIDIAPAMVSRAREKSKGMRDISFAVADITDYRAEGEFDLVLCTYDSINYVLMLRDLRRMLKNVAAALRPGGLFLFDSNTKRLYRHHHGYAQERELDGHAFVQECLYDSRRNRGITRFLFPDGTYEQHTQRPYDMNELEPLLDAAGLKVTGVFSWFDRKPYSAKTEKLFCMAEKK